MENTLLTYMFATNPAPLMASSPTAPQEGRINAGVFGQGEPVYCNVIRIQVPVGTEAADAFKDTPQASINTSRWLVQSVQMVPGDEAGLDPGMDAAQFTFVARDPTDDHVSYSLILGLVGPVSDTAGSFTYTVEEHSGTTPDRSTYVWRKSTYQLDKTPTQLYLRNFFATTKDRQTAPATQVTASAALRLDWSSSGAWFELYAGDEPAPVYQGQATFVELAAGISRDTTFFLLASAFGNPGQDNGQGEYKVIYAYATLSLAVTSPTLPGLSVTGPLKAGGTATMTGTAEFSAAATFHQDVTVDGKMKAGQLDMANVTVENLTATASVKSPIVGAGTLENQGGGAPFVNAGQKHLMLFKWIGLQDKYMLWQFFCWDQGQRWGGLRLPAGDYKTFVIDHPLRPDRYLVHATLEGPEAAVYYRGTAQLAGGRAEVFLPDYADALTDPDSWTVQLTNIAGFDRLALDGLDGRTVSKGRFVIIAEDPDSTQAFHWEAKGARRDRGPLDTEPAKAGLDVRGFGPYTFAVPAR